MPWIRITIARFKIGFYRNVPFSVMMCGWIYFWWVKNEYFEKTGKALREARNELMVNR